MAERKAKIICTLGPASVGPSVLFSLVRKGMDVARLNFSHGDHDRPQEGNRIGQGRLGPI